MCQVKDKVVMITRCYKPDRPAGTAKLLASSWRAGSRKEGRKGSGQQVYCPSLRPASWRLPVRTHLCRGGVGGSMRHHETRSACGAWPKEEQHEQSHSPCKSMLKRTPSDSLERFGDGTRSLKSKDHRRRLRSRGLSGGRCIKAMLGGF